MKHLIVIDPGSYRSRTFLLQINLSWKIFIKIGMDSFVLVTVPFHCISFVLFVPTKTIFTSINVAMFNLLFTPFLYYSYYNFFFTIATFSMHSFRQKSVHIFIRLYLLYSFLHFFPFLWKKKKSFRCLCVEIFSIQYYWYTKLILHYKRRQFNITNEYLSAWSQVLSSLFFGLS